MYFMISTKYQRNNISHELDNFFFWVHGDARALFSIITAILEWAC